MFSEKYKIVPCGIDIDIATATDNLSDSINMKNYHSCTFLIQYEDMGTANHTLLVYSGVTAAALTSALPFKLAFGSAAFGTANCDVLTTWTSVATTGHSVAHGTYDNYMAIIEVDAADMDIANGENWLTLDFQDTGNADASGRAIVFAVLKPRYTKGQSLTAVA